MTLSVIMWAGLFVAWMLIPSIVTQYRYVIVPTRYREIKERFLPCGSGPRAQEKSAAWYYVRLNRPGVDPDDPVDAEGELKSQFWHFHSWWRYFVPLVIVVVLSGLMLSLSGLWIIEKLSTPADAPPSASTLIGRIPVPFIMALWGAFVWSLYEIWTRRKSGDLTPVEVVDVELRLVVAIPIGYAFSLLAIEPVPSLAAFAASAFPLRDVRQLIRKHALQKWSVNDQVSSTRASKGYLGEVLSGIGNDTIVRLEELNIETYFDLAYADPIRLMVKTGVPIQLVLAWIDQALLAVYAAPHKAQFELLGMPCALDVREFYLDHFGDPRMPQQKDWRNDKAVVDLAASLKIPLEIMPQLLRSVTVDPHVEFLARAWYGVDTSKAAASAEVASPRSALAV
jgi:hypothetical protein